MSVSMQREPESPPAEPAPSPDATRTADCADANACMELAQKLRAAKDGAGALAAFEHACEKGSPEGCYTAGDWLARKPEWSKALPLYQHGCELGSLKACSEVGYAYTEGTGVDKDPAKANEIFEKACSSGHAFRACASACSTTTATA
jgi:TPR repeat protein